MSSSTCSAQARPSFFPSWSFQGARYQNHMPPAPGTLFLSFCPLFFEGHKDSVTCAGFSHDSTLVATGDMSGLLKVWQVDTKEEVWSFEAGDLEVRSSERESALWGLGLLGVQAWEAGSSLLRQASSEPVRPKAQEEGLPATWKIPAEPQRQETSGGAHRTGF